MSDFFPFRVETHLIISLIQSSQWNSHLFSNNKPMVTASSFTASSWNWTLNITPLIQPLCKTGKIFTAQLVTAFTYGILIVVAIPVSELARGVMAWWVVFSWIVGASLRKNVARICFIDSDTNMTSVFPLNFQGPSGDAGTSGSPGKRVR